MKNSIKSLGITHNHSISYYHNKASKLAVKRTKELALDILRKNAGLKEFVMAMGGYFFIDKNDNALLITRNPSRIFKPLINHMNKWDKIYGISGYAMRFTKNGKVTRNW